MTHGSIETLEIEAYWRARYLDLLEEFTETIEKAEAYKQELAKVRKEKARLENQVWQLKKGKKR